MPSTDDHILDFDHTREAPGAALEPGEAPADLWDGAPSAPPGKKKKKAKKKDVAPQRYLNPEDDEPAPAYPPSITPSPPTNGVRLHASPPAAHSVPDDSPPLLYHVEEEEDLDPLPSPRPGPRPAFHAAAATAAARSPRPVPARPFAALDRPAARRESFGVPPAVRPRFVDPPPPHKPQPHYFTLPSLGLNFGQKTSEKGRPAGSDGYCCSLDSLADAAEPVSAKRARDALLVGSEGGLEVFRILPNKLEVVGRLEGLRGAVIAAKILPYTDPRDPWKFLRPLVAVVVHGPMVQYRGNFGRNAEPYDVEDDDFPKHSYQTTVEIYSLITHQHITTLFESAPVAGQPGFGQASSRPEPAGDLVLDASGRFITVSSGKSGEIYVFAGMLRAEDGHLVFRCIGKFWTAVQSSLTPASRPPTAGESPAAAGQSKDPSSRPICSLSQRWLAIVPPLTSSAISISGKPVPSEINPSPPGVTTHVAPPQPLVTCEVVGTDVEGTWSRLGKAAAQGLVKYSQRGIEMGLQGWKELTYPSPPSAARPAHDRNSSKDELFPPTKGPMEDPGRLANEPALVSIIDLESLLQSEETKPKHVAPPMATFALVEGCSFVSLSSMGARLLTSSRKGEVSTVWDLAQVAHGVAKHGSQASDENSSAPCVKQLYRMARNTPSIVLACTWTREDDALGILTAHGTVHLHEVPTQPTSKKRKRRSTASAPAEKAEATVSLSTGLSPPSSNQGFLGSIKSGWQTVSTQVNSIRSVNAASALGLPTSFAGFREATAAAGTAGSRAVAKGLSQGFVVAKGGASDYWHADDNKLRHKALQDPNSAKSIRWMRRNHVNLLLIACGGMIHVHHIERATRRKGDETISGLKHERYAEKRFPLPPIATLEETGPLHSTGTEPEGFWTFRQHHLPREADLNPYDEDNNAKALQNRPSDVETNPPYCPFHADPRANIFAYGEHEFGSQLRRYEPSASYEDFRVKGHDCDGGEAWTFGGALPSAHKVNERVPEEYIGGGFDDDKDDDDGDGDYDEEDEYRGIASQMESKLTIQPAGKSTSHGGEIRINTRPRQGRRGGGGGRTESEFDIIEGGDDGMF